MSEDTNFQNNPLHGVSLQNLLSILVEHYGFEIMFAYLNINCFKTNPSIESSAKFLKKTEWAKEKVESFYLYEYCNLPRASASQFAMPPRDRIMPPEQKPGTPKELSLEDAERLREKREKKASEFSGSSNRGGGGYRGDARRSDGDRRSNPYHSGSGNRGSQERSNRGKPFSESDGSRGRRDDTSSAPLDKGADPWGNWKK